VRRGLKDAVEFMPSLKMAMPYDLEVMPGANVLVATIDSVCGLLFEFPGHSIMRNE
jgi:hypothetical protein